MLANKVGVGLTFELRSQLVRKLHALGVGYYDRHQVGSLVSRVAYDSEVLHTLLQQITGGFLLQLVQVIAVGIMLFTLNPKLALYILIPDSARRRREHLLLAARLSQLLPLLGFQQQAGRHAVGHAAGHPGGQGVCPGAARVRPVSPLERLPEALARDRRKGERLVHVDHGADLQPGRLDRLVRRRPRGAGRQDDARLADGVPRLPGDVLRSRSPRSRS